MLRGSLIRLDGSHMQFNVFDAGPGLTELTLPGSCVTVVKAMFHDDGDDGYLAIESLTAHAGDPEEIKTLEEAYKDLREEI